MKPRIILVGGFLGAGKTTLLWKTAEMLTKGGETLPKSYAGGGTKVAMITNDQASALVDTALLARSGMATKEVSGSCFCCNFPGFEEAIRSVMPGVEDGVILAEPVGSCTDLSATIVQTLKDRMADDIVVSPLSVLTDPARLEDILAGGDSGLHPSSAYIVKKQMEEADYILVNKIDTITEEKKKELVAKASEKYPNAEVLAVSGLTGEGVGEWLNAITSDEKAGTHLAEVDYDTYAEGEAVLGWLNTSIKLKGGSGEDWRKLAEDILHRFSDLCVDKGAGIGHVKLMIQGGATSAQEQVGLAEEHRPFSQEQGSSGEGTGTFVRGNLTAGPDTIKVEGESKGEPEVELTFNARVEMSPEDLEKMALDMIRELCAGKAETDILVVNSLMPGRPDPTYRYTAIIQ